VIEKVNKIPQHRGGERVREGPGPLHGVLDAGEDVGPREAEHEPHGLRPAHLHVVVRMAAAPGQRRCVWGKERGDLEKSQYQ